MQLETGRSRECTLTETEQGVPKVGPDSLVEPAVPGHNILIMHLPKTLVQGQSPNVVCMLPAPIWPSAQ